MFKFDSNLVQVELGNRALAVLFPKGNRKGKKGADGLISATEQLRQKLEAEGIPLPGVLISEAPELPENTFRITFGIACEDFDVSRHAYIFALEKKAREFSLANLSSENVREELNTALKYVLQKDYQSAMLRLMRVYYLSSLTEDQTARVVSLLNMAGICLINNQLGEAYVASKQAQLIVEKSGFYDPHLKFYAHKAIANIEVLQNDFESGAAHFEQAFNDIKSAGDVQLIIDALYNEASVYMHTGSYKKCARALNTIVSYIENNTLNDIDREFLLTLYKMRDQIAVHTEEELARNVYQLQKAYYELSCSIPRKVANTILTILTDYGPYFVSTCIGALMSGDTYYTNQYTASGSNIIARKVCLQ